MSSVAPTAALLEFSEARQDVVFVESMSVSLTGLMKGLGTEKDVILASVRAYLRHDFSG